MSDPNGQQTVPKAPDFSSSSFSYGPQRISEIKVKSVDGKTVDTDPNTVIKSGSTPGTFSAQPSAPKSVTYNAPQAKIPVGGEVKRSDPEKDKNAKLYDLLKKEGFEVEVNDAGEIENVSIPKEYLFEEELKKLIPLSQTFAVLKAGIEKVQNQIKDPSAAAILLSSLEEVEKLIEDIKANPSEEKLSELQGRLDELSEAKEKAEKEIADHFDSEKEILKAIIKLSVEINTTINEARLLESKISDQKTLDKFKKETNKIEADLLSLQNSPDEDKKKKLEKDFAFYKKNLQDVEDFITKNPKVGTPEQKPESEVNITDIYSSWRFGNLPIEKRKEATAVFNTKYRPFIEKARHAKQLDACTDIIKEKLVIQEEIKKLNPKEPLQVDISQMLSLFVIHIEEKEEELKKLQEEGSAKKKVGEIKKTVLEKAKSVSLSEYKKWIEEIEARGASGDTAAYLTRITADFVKKVKKIEKTIDTLKPEELEQKLKELDEEKKKIDEIVRKEEEKRTTIDGGFVLRPFKLTPQNRNKKIFANGTKTGQDIANEYAAIDKFKKEEAEKAAKQAEIETRALFERAFKNDPQAFIAKYVDERTSNGTVRHTMKHELMIHPYKNIIAEILTDTNNPGHLKDLFEPDLSELLTDKAEGKGNRTQRFNEKPRLEQKSSITENRTLYSPIKDPYIPHIEGEKEKAPLPKPFLPHTEEEEAVYLAQIGNKNGEHVENHPQMELNKDNYQMESMAPITAVQMHESKQEIVEKKIGIVDRLRQTLNKNIPTWQGVAATMALSLAVAGGIKVGTKETIPETPTISQSQEQPEQEWVGAQVEDAKMWEKYWAERFDYPNLPEDLRTKKVEQIVQTYCPSFFKRDKSPARIAQVCAMFANDIAHNSEANTYNLSDDERTELSKWRKALDDMLFALEARNFEKGKNRHLSDEIREVQQAIAKRESGTKKA